MANERLIYYNIDEITFEFSDEVRIYQNEETKRLTRKVVNTDLNSISGRHRYEDEITPEQLFQIVDNAPAGSETRVRLSKEDREFYQAMLDEEKENLEL